MRCHTHPQEIEITSDDDFLVLACDGLWDVLDSKDVIEIVAEQMGVDKGEISRATSFTNDLNADSLDTVELVMEFEDEFDTTIPDDQAEKISTVGHAIDYIMEHMGD